MAIIYRYKLELDEIEGEMLKAALDLMHKSSVEQAQKSGADVFYEFATIAKAVQYRLNPIKYEDDCPFCRGLIRKAPTVCERCGTAFSESPRAKFGQGGKTVDSGDGGQGRLNVYLEWRRLMGY
jgi:hypothetical protein